MPATITRSAAQAIAEQINAIAGGSMSGRRVPANIDGTVGSTSYNGAGSLTRERPVVSAEAIMLTVPWAGQLVTVDDIASAAGSTQPCGLCDPSNPYGPAGRCPECGDSGEIAAWA